MVFSMRYRIEQVRLNITDSKKSLKKAVLKRLGKGSLNIYDIKIVRESIDARKKGDIKLVYTIDFTCDEKLPLKNPPEVKYNLGEILPELPEDFRISSPVVVGFGPAGMFAALILAQAGLNPVVIERGEAIEERAETVDKFWKTGKLNVESNVQFGEGGAGTFSDGKLTTGIKDIRISKVLEELVEAGADESILYKQKPHIGTDKLREVVVNIRKKIESLGGKIYFCRKLTDIKTVYKNGDVSIAEIKIEKTKADKNEKSEQGIRAGGCIKTDALVLATGHSARDTFKMLYEKGLPMEQKPFSIGVRIQHPQRMIDESQYGTAAAAEILGPAEYKLSYKCENGRGVYTFCMCPGGEIIDSSSEPMTAVTNGMSYSDRGGRFANSGLLVDVRPGDFSSDCPLAGIEFQRKYEKKAYEMGKGNIPETTYGLFRTNDKDPVRESLPEFAAKSIIEAMPHMGRRLRGFDNENAVFKGVETRSSSPVRIIRDETGQTEIRGIFPAGEGPGYAGGIVSAAVDGIKAAENIIKVIFS
ncbi:MAG: NAD(P)/FAD-dependent oxidoreductase [Anaerovoracaceae bacterium]